MCLDLRIFEYLGIRAKNGDDHDDDDDDVIIRMIITISYRLLYQSINQSTTEQSKVIIRHMVYVIYHIPYTGIPYISSKNLKEEVVVKKK